MKDVILIELANRWIADAAYPKEILNEEEGGCIGARNAAIRETKRECADTLITLVQMLGDK